MQCGIEFEEIKNIDAINIYLSIDRKLSGFYFPEIFYFGKNDQIMMELKPNYDGIKNVKI